MNKLSTAYLSLGSNIGDRSTYLKEAQAELNKSVGHVLEISRMFENPPVGFNADQDFLNICIKIETALSPKDLLKSIKSIEEQMGRKMKVTSGYSSRCIDIDIILYDRIILKSEDLTIPHSEFKKRRFVLMPLNDIASSEIDPETMLTIHQLYVNCSDQSHMSVYKD